MDREAVGERFDTVEVGAMQSLNPR